MKHCRIYKFKKESNCIFYKKGKGGFGRLFQETKFITEKLVPIGGLSVEIPGENIFLSIEIWRSNEILLFTLPINRFAVGGRKCSLEVSLFLHKERKLSQRKHVLLHSSLIQTSEAQIIN